MTPEVVVAGALLFGLIAGLGIVHRAVTRSDGSPLPVSWPVLLAGCLLAALVVSNVLEGSWLWVAIDGVLLILLVAYVVTGRKASS